MDERLILRVRQMIGFDMTLSEIATELAGEVSPEAVFLAFHAARLLTAFAEQPLPLTTAD